MLDKVIENNRVSIIGEVVSEFEFSHEVFGEGFYLVNVSVNRLSDMVDIIPLMISERLVDVTKDYRGRKIEVSGQFRSYNRHEGVKNKLILSIFVREMQFIEEEEIPEEQARTNQIFLDGYVCKPPLFGYADSLIRPVKYRDIHFFFQLVNRIRQTRLGNKQPVRGFCNRPCICNCNYIF